jgi:hypothetical protein
MNIGEADLTNDKSYTAAHGIAFSEIADAFQPK